MSQGQGWLRSLAQLTQFTDCRPGVGKTDEPHQTMSLSVICLKSGKVEGGGKWGMVCVFKNGRMMFKHKNKSFSFPETLFIYYFFKFLFFFRGGGGHIGRCPKAEAPRSQLCPGSLAGESPKRPTKAAWPAGSRDGRPWACSRQLLCPEL